MMNDFNTQGKGSQHNSKLGIQSEEEMRADNGSRNPVREERCTLVTLIVCFAQGFFTVGL